MRIEDPSPEQAERIKGCEDPVEVLALMAEDGVELTDEQLEGVAGGAWGSDDVCPSSPNQKHKCILTGNEKSVYGPNRGFTTEYEMRCEHCGKVNWGKKREAS